MSEENENTLLKNLLEYIPIVVFFIVFILFKDDVVVLFGRDLSGFVLARVIKAKALNYAHKICKTRPKPSHKPFKQTR